MNRLYRAGGTELINNDLLCEIGLFTDEEVPAALADGWCLHYSETAKTQKRKPAKQEEIAPEEPEQSVDAE